MIVNILFRQLESGVDLKMADFVWMGNIDYDIAFRVPNNYWG